MSSNYEGNSISTAGSLLGIAAKETYEGKVALEALNRAGRNPNIKGIVHEILFKDKLNIGNIFSAKEAVLTSSTTAVRDDVIIKAAGKVIGRTQLKDTAGSIFETIKQVSEGKYAGTSLMGTKETAALFNKAAAGREITQRMSSTGISSLDTARIGSKALGQAPSTGALIAGVKGSGFMGGALSGGIEAVSSLGELANGRMSGGEYTGRVLKETVGGGISAGVATAASSFATAAASRVVMSAAATSLGGALGGTALGGAVIAGAPIVAGIGAAVLIGTGVKKIFDGIFG